MAVTPARIPKKGPVLKFFIKCVPPTQTHQAKRLGVVQGRARMFKGKKQREIEATLTQLLLPYQPGSPITGPYALQIHITFPPNKGQQSSKVKRDHFENGGIIPHVAKPDVDNFAKGFIDELVKLRFIEDDMQVLTLTVSKCVGLKAGIAVSISQVRDLDPFLDHHQIMLNTRSSV